MHSNNRFGIVAEETNRRASIFNIDTLRVTQQIPLQADAIDVAMAYDGRSAVVSSFSSKTMFQFRLSNGHAEVVGSAVSPTFLEDVQLTLNGKYALSVDGSAANQDIVSYALANNSFVSTLPTSAQAVAISPISSLVLTAEYSANKVRRFTLDNRGNLTDTGQEFPAGSQPINLIFSPDGLFAFVVNSTTPGAVSVLSALNPGNILLLDTVPTTSTPQSLAVTRDGGHVFALGSSAVDIFSFDAVAGSLRLENSFAHGLTIRPYFGVDQIALDPEDARLFISGVGQVAVFTTYGLPLGTVLGAAGPGGLDIARSMQPSDPCWQNEE